MDERKDEMVSLADCCRSRNRNDGMGFTSVLLEKGLISSPPPSECSIIEDQTSYSPHSHTTTTHLN